MNRSSNFCTASIAAASGVYGGSTSKVSLGWPNGSDTGPSSTDGETALVRVAGSFMTQVWHRKVNAG
ncbi:hypothetical protein GCM10011376_01210 [Nocardioides flavus (ex Wang et al. 2016)]|uniref:Uncharacterized protein n=1 Tax=Nocardioides flavus (ex Wang et al. 2016) TaxID=2058780 RepID=A0ABQ3HFE9_9ACTN|nr:hypothetical protein GCM10011376_01210 [Nocardioides flavus (ex Wang et al. 2016)]